jgi:Ca-activated chloride channel family protein
LLKRAAQQTGGQYFRATGNDKLKEVYSQIDKLERSKIKISNYHRKAERFHLFLGIAVMALLLEVGLRNTYLKTLVN